MKVILLLSLLVAFNSIKGRNLAGGAKTVITKPSTTKTNPGKLTKIDIKTLLRDRLTNILKKTSYLFISRRTNGCLSQIRHKR